MCIRDSVQKVLVGREIASAPTVLLTAYVVRGLDINSSYTIYDPVSYTHLDVYKRQGNMQSFGTALQNFQNFRILLRKIDTLLLLSLIHI